MNDNNNNNNNSKAQGYILTAATKFLMTIGTLVWPVRIYDPAGSLRKPYPRYKGSARLEGSDKQSLYTYWTSAGFQACVLFVEGVRLLNRANGKLCNYLPPEGMYLAAIVRYTECGVPELRIITKSAPEETTEKCGWTRQPVRAEGETDAERHRFVRELIRSTLREDEVPQDEVSLNTIREVFYEEDPFVVV
jgi:hypothetical protein